MDIYGKIGKVMGDLPAIGKESVNKQQGWVFRGIDTIMNYVSPLFVKHGVFMVPQVLDSTREERQTKNGGNMIYTRLKVKYLFYATSDGSSIEAVVEGEGMDSGDKSTNKALAVAMKYALFQVLCIPTEEMAQKERLIDPDETSPEESYPVDMAGNRIYRCCDCGRDLTPITGKDGKEISVEDQLALGRKYAGGRIVCPECLKKNTRKSA